MTERSNGPISEYARMIPQSVTYTSEGPIVKSRIYATSEEAAQKLADLTGAHLVDDSRRRSGGRSSSVSFDRKSWNAPWTPSATVKRDLELAEAMGKKAAEQRRDSETIQNN
jgi:hypothetical protein